MLVWLEELAKKCGPYMKIKKIYYLISSLSLEEGLMRVYANKEMLQIAKIVLTNGCIDLHVLHGVDEPNIVPIIDSSSQEAQQHTRKMTPRMPTPKSVTPQLSSKTPFSHKDAVTSSKQNPKDIASTKNSKEQPSKPHSTPFESQPIIQEN